MGFGKGYGNRPESRPRKRERRKGAPRQISLRRFSVVVYPLSDSESGHADHVLGQGVVTDITRDRVGLILDRPIRFGLAVMLVLNANGPFERQLTASAISAAKLPSTGHILKLGQADLADSSSKGPYRVGLRLTALDDEQTRYVEALISNEEA
jgi:hypothetical protein